MANDSKSLDLQIKIATEEALRAVSSIKGELQSLATEAKNFSGGNGLKNAFASAQQAAEKAAVSMRLFGVSSGELRQAQAELKNAAVELVRNGLDPQSDEVKKLVEEYKKLEKAAAGIDEANGSNIDSFGELKSSIMSLAEVAAALKALSVIKDMGAFALETADAFQTARDQFGVLLGDMRAGAGLFNEIKAFGDKTPFDLSTLTQATNVLIAAKVPLKDLQSQLAKFGDLSQGSAQKLASYINAFSQASAKGKADMQVLNTYLNQGVPILDALAKNFGKTTAEIIEMSSQGQISFEEFSRALDDLTAAGGQYFGGMELASQSLAAMREGLQEAVSSLAASFGEMLAPAAIAVVEALTGITNAINESPILKGILAGALVTITGYLAAMAVKAAVAFAAQMKLNLAVGALNPAVLASTLAVAGMAAGYTMLASKLQQSTRETESLKYEQRKLNDTMRDGTRTIEEYRESISNMSVGELLNAIERVREVRERLNTNRDLGWVTDSLRDIEREFAERRSGFINAFYKETSYDKIQELQDIIRTAEVFLQDIENEIMFLQETRRDSSAELNTKNQLLEIVRATRSELDRLELAGTEKKRWQEWYGEITKIDPSLIGGSGAKAAELYLAGFERALAAQTTISEILGEHLDLAGMLRKRQADIQKALVDLFSINPDEIDDPFEPANRSIAPLIEEYRRLGEEIERVEESLRAAAAQEEFARTMADLAKQIDDLGKSEHQLAYEAELARTGIEAQSEQALELARAMDRLAVAGTLSGLGVEVQNLGKDQYDLALATLAAADATEEEIKQAEEMIETLRRFGQTFEEFLSQKISGGLMDIFPELEKQAAEAVANIATQLSMISFDGLLGGLSAIGEAFAKGEDAAENLKQAMADMARRILDQLPGMFLQAGLQLIAQGQWPLGLGFIAAAGASAIISGCVKGATQHAQGAVFDEYGKAAREFALGGAFTNRIVNQPTFFRYGGSLGVMGEAGPEAILPLKRMPGGNLGVETSGGGTAVFININNYSGTEARKEETTDSNGNRHIDIIIGEFVNKHISSGKADRAMARYGIRATGV